MRADYLKELRIACFGAMAYGRILSNVSSNLVSRKRLVHRIPFKSNARLRTLTKTCNKRVVWQW